MLSRFKNPFGTASLEEAGSLSSIFVRTACLDISSCRAAWDNVNPLHSSSPLAQFMWVNAAERMGHEMDEESFRVQVLAAEDLLMRVEGQMSAEMAHAVMPEEMRTRRFARAVQAQAPRLAVLCRS